MRWLRLTEAQKYVKKTTHLDISVLRIRSWITGGLITYSGYRVVLQARKRFGLWYTREDWINEFIKEQSE